MKPRTPRPRPTASALPRFRPLLAVLLALAALCYLAPLAATALIGQDTLRAQAQRALEAAMGHEVQLDGPVRLTMSPWLCLRTGPLTVANAPGFGPEPLAEVRSVVIGLDLWGLLQKRILVESIALGDPILRLSRDARGRENWLSLDPSAQGEQSPSGWKADSLPYGLRLENASLAYTDALTGARFAVSRLNLRTGSGKTFDFSLSCTVAARHLDAGAEIHIKGKASYGPTGEHLFVHGAEIQGVLGKARGDGTAEPQARFSAMMRFHGQGGAVEVSNLTVEGLGVRLAGQVNVAGLYEDTPSVQCALTASAERDGPWRSLFHLENADQATAARGPTLRAPAPERIEAELAFGASAGSWKLDKFELRDGPGRLTAQASRLNRELRFTLLATDLDLDAWIPRGGLNLPGADPASWASLLPGAPGGGPPPGPGPARPDESVRGTASAKDVRLAGMDVDSLLLSAQGEQGALRLYPITIQAADSVAGADVRLRATPAGVSFDVMAGLDPLFQKDVPGASPVAQASPLPDRLAKALLAGELSPAGASGTFQLRLDDLPPAWRKARLPASWCTALDCLGSLGGPANPGPGGHGLAAPGAGGHGLAATSAGGHGLAAPGPGGNGLAAPGPGGNGASSAAGPGVLSAKGAFRTAALRGGSNPAWTEWEATGLEVNAGGCLITGSLAGKQGRTVADLTADRLELDKLGTLATALAPQAALAAASGPGRDASAGFSPWPLEGRAGVRRLAAWGLDFEDVQATGQVSARAVKLSTLSATLAGGKLSGGFTLEDKDGRRQAGLNLAAAGLQGATLSAVLPGGLRLAGPLDGRVNLEASEPLGQPLWRNAHAQAELQMGAGAVAFGAARALPGQAGPQPWPVTRAVLGLKLVGHTPPMPGGPGLENGHEPREAALVDVTGGLRLEMPGTVRQFHCDLRGLAGLDPSGRPLWYRQPQAEGGLSFVVPLAQPVRMANCQWKGKFEADLDRGGFALSDVELTAAGLPARLRLSGAPGPASQAGQNGQNPMTFAGMLDIPEFNPREAALRLGLTVPTLAAPQTWKRARLSADLSGTARDMRFTRITAALDDALLTGQAAVADGKTRLDLAVDVLDLDRLSPGQAVADPANRPEQAIPLDLLRKLALDVRLQAGRLVKSKLVWGNALLEATVLDGRFSYRQQAEDFYKGKFRLNVNGDARGPELKAQTSMRVSGTSGVDLLKDLSDGSALTKGVLEFELDAATSGNTDKTLMRRLAGTARFDLANGGMVFRDSGAKQREAAAAPQPVVGDRDAPPAKSAPAAADAMPFGRMGAAFVIRQGVGATKEFMFTGPEVSAKGGGIVSLVDETITLNLLATVRDIGELPVHIHGPLYDPKLDIDRSGILGDTIVKIVKGVVNIPGSLLSHLRGLF